MLEIKFDDATREKAWDAIRKSHNLAHDVCAHIYAAEANRQLAEHVAKCSVITDEELAQELRTAWCNYYDAEGIWIVLAHTARELLAFSQTKPVSEIDWKARAEKAEARLERVRAAAEATAMRRLEGAFAEFHRGFSGAVEMFCAAAGFKIIPAIPAQPLRVEARDE